MELRCGKVLLFLALCGTTLAAVCDRSVVSNYFPPGTNWPFNQAYQAGNSDQIIDTAIGFYDDSNADRTGLDAVALTAAASSIETGFIQYGAGAIAFLQSGSIYPVATQGLFIDAYDATTGIASYMGKNLPCGVRVLHSNTDQQPSATEWYVLKFTTDSPAYFVLTDQFNAQATADTPRQVLMTVLPAAQIRALFPGTCSDLILNQDETSIDQGGPCGTCSDNIQNGGETSKDQGGVCGTCSDDIQNGGETSKNQGGVCGTCSDNIQNGGETSKDQGGVCGTCSDDIQNGGETSKDQGGVCGTCSDNAVNGGETTLNQGGICGTCSDNIQNGGETSTDQGGVCGTCSDGTKNGGETDTDYGGACGTCSDRLQNGNELGVDCGNRCPNCPSCSDGIKNQGEEGVDCNGPCLPGKVCATCFDGVQNQAEAGVDCGGPCVKICETCSDGIKNQAEQAVDCGGPCSECQGTCCDGVKNRDETGIDCGGVSCLPCAASNLALNKPTQHISTSGAAPAAASSKAVDGNTNGDFSVGACSLTSKETEPWWTVDLERDYVVSKVHLFNRIDCCWSDISGVKVAVTQTRLALSSTGSPDFTTVQPAWLCNTSGLSPSNTVNNELSVPCSSVTGRYVYVWIPRSPTNPNRKKALALCEVKVTGTNVPLLGTCCDGLMTTSAGETGVDCGGSCMPCVCPTLYPSNIKKQCYGWGDPHITPLNGGPEYHCQIYDGTTVDTLLPVLVLDYPTIGFRIVGFQKKWSHNTAVYGKFVIRRLSPCPGDEIVISGSNFVVGSQTFSIFNFVATDFTGVKALPSANGVLFEFANGINVRTKWDNHPLTDYFTIWVDVPKNYISATTGQCAAEMCQAGANLLSFAKLEVDGLDWSSLDRRVTQAMAEDACRFAENTPQEDSCMIDVHAGDDMRIAASAAVVYAASVAFAQELSLECDSSVSIQLDDLYDNIVSACPRDLCATPAGQEDCSAAVKSLIDVVYDNPLCAIDYDSKIQSALAFKDNCINIDRCPLMDIAGSQVRCAAWNSNLRAFDGTLYDGHTAVIFEHEETGIKVQLVAGLPQIHLSGSCYDDELNFIAFTHEILFDTDGAVVAATFAPELSYADLPVTKGFYVYQKRANEAIIHFTAIGTAVGVAKVGDKYNVWIQTPQSVADSSLGECVSPTASALAVVAPSSTEAQRACSFAKDPAAVPSAQFFYFACLQSYDADSDVVSTLEVLSSLSFLSSECIPEDQFQLLRSVNTYLSSCDCGGGQGDCFGSANSVPALLQKPTVRACLVTDEIITQVSQVVSTDPYEYFLECTNNGSDSSDWSSSSDWSFSDESESEDDCDSDKDKDASESAASRLTSGLLAVVLAALAF